MDEMVLALAELHIDQLASLRRAAIEAMQSVDYTTVLDSIEDAAALRMQRLWDEGLVVERVKDKQARLDRAYAAHGWAVGHELLQDALFWESFNSGGNVMIDVYLKVGRTLADGAWYTVSWDSIVEYFRSDGALQADYNAMMDMFGTDEGDIGKVVALR